MKVTITIVFYVSITIVRNMKPLIFSRMAGTPIHIHILRHKRIMRNDFHLITLVGYMSMYMLEGPCRGDSNKYA